VPLVTCIVGDDIMDFTLEAAREIDKDFPSFIRSTDPDEFVVHSLRH